ncbi:MAG TPA: GAF and ANTAR domain-containing protein [Nocardioidaceae bacterium]|nr:GAF and ANTAR domain-containing protein [Nocardioidaceae bacterium]
MVQDLPLADELAAVYARMSGVLLSQETVTTALQLVTALALETVPGSVGAGVTLIEGGRRTSAAATDALVEQADALQYELDEGPCLSAWAERAVVRVEDTAVEARWSRWCGAVQPLGLRSALSAAMVAGDTALGAIKVYAREPGAYGDRSEHLLTLFAAQAAILLSNMQTHERAQQLSDGLRDALASRDVIGQAKGILMAQDGIDGDAAFAMLAAASQRENRKLRDVAQDMVESVEVRRLRLRP